MRTSLFLSAMLAVALTGSFASAEKPDQRQKGDTVDKSYSKMEARQRIDRAARQTRTQRIQKDPALKRPGEAKWNCGEDDCRTHHASALPTRQAGSPQDAASGKPGAAPARINDRAEQRWNCADDSCSGVRSAAPRTEAQREARGKNAAERATAARLGVRGTTVADRTKDGGQAKVELTELQKRRAEKLSAMLKKKVCAKLGADCQ